MKITNYVVVLEQSADKFILLNPANAGTIRVSKEIYKKIKNNDIKQFTEAEIEFLQKAGFIGEDDFDEKLLNEVKSVYIDSSLNLVFMTSENCNFRCSYCYESHTNHHIERDVYDSALKLVNNSSKENLIINWFGGEPLLEVEDIEYFMKKVYDLKKFKSINSSIITNGYLLTEKNFNKLMKANVKVFQITLDGLKTEHDKQRYLKNGMGTFDRIVENLRYMKSTNEDFVVYLRYNYNEQSNPVEYVRYVKSLVGKDKRFVLDFHPIGDWSSTNKGLPHAHHNDDIFIAKKDALESGMRIRNIEEDTCPAGYFCSAHRDEAYIINYKRDVMKCTIMLDWDKNIIGKLNKDGTIEFNDNYELWHTPIHNEKCATCNVRPVCMSKYCPHIDKNACKETIEKKIKDVLEIKYV